MKFTYGNHKWINVVIYDDSFKAFYCELCGLNYDIEYRLNLHGKYVEEEYWRINHSINWKCGKPPKTCEEVRMIEALE